MVNEKMTALADEIRVLSGTATSKSIDAMTSDVGAANTEISEQMELIAQISTALENKVAGGGGVTLPELDNPASASDILKGKEAIDGDGEAITGTIETKTSSNLTASGATVTVPAGYYASQATKSVSSGSVKIPATIITNNPTISIDSAGKITASVSGTQNLTPYVTAGYISSIKAGAITVSGSATKQLTTQVAKTVTPSTSSQTAVASGVYTTGAITVAAIPSNYEDVGTETTEYTSLNAELEEVINSLPDASSGESGGAGIETCTVTLASRSPATDVVFYYSDGSSLKQCVFPGFGAADVILTDVLKNSIVYTAGSTSGWSGSYQTIDRYTSSSARAYFITGDATFATM
jgi:hypothetical protein